MRKFLTASICLVIIFAGFGCGEKKGGKASMRDRGGVTGKVTPVPGLPADPNAVATLSEKDKKIAEAAKKAEAKSCVADAPKVTQPSDEETLSGFSDLVDGTDNEYVLTEATYYYASEDGTKYPGQIVVSTTGAVNEKELAAVTEANEKTKIVCENSVTDKHVALEVTSKATVVSRFNTKDGSSLKLRQFGGKAIGSITDKANRFLDGDDNIVDDEKNALALNITGENDGVVSKDKAGNAYWRLSTREPVLNKKDTFNVTSIVAKYEKRPVASTLTKEQIEAAAEAKAKAKEEADAKLAADAKALLDAAAATGG